MRSGGAASEFMLALAPWSRPRERLPMSPAASRSVRKYNVSSKPESPFWQDCVPAERKGWARRTVGSVGIELSEDCNMVMCPQ